MDDCDRSEDKLSVEVLKSPKRLAYCLVCGVDHATEDATGDKPKMRWHNGPAKKGWYCEACWPEEPGISCISCGTNITKEGSCYCRGEERASLFSWRRSFTVDLEQVQAVQYIKTSDQPLRVVLYHVQGRAVESEAIWFFFTREAHLDDQY